MATTGTVTVEFYGIPRQRAGRAELVVPAGTVAQVLAAVQRACPALIGLAGKHEVARHYLLSVEGDRFVRRLDEIVDPGLRLLLLSADAGG
jgi:molybdopterin converting factor small subunit